MKEVNEKYMKKIYLNILKAIIILTYFLVLNLACEKVSALYLERGIELCTMVFLIIAIGVFEMAYKKDDDDLAIQGIEILVLSAYTLTSQHITKKYNFDFKTYSLVASYIFAIYFILKCIVVYTKGRKEMAENMSDIKEIVKKEEPIKKEATKKTVENKEENKKENKEENKKENKKEKNKKEETLNTENKEKTKKSTSKRTPTTKSKTTKTASKKTTESKAKSTTNKTTTTKKAEAAKKTTTRKTGTTKKTTATKKTEAAKKTTATKKAEEPKKATVAKKKTTTKKKVEEEKND